MTSHRIAMTAFTFGLLLTSAGLVTPAVAGTLQAPKTCKPYFVHATGKQGATVARATKSAVRAWRIKVRHRIGRPWAKTNVAAKPKRTCVPLTVGWKCRFRAIPCRIN